METMAQYSGQLVFGLDIGTRSIVGTVGYKKDDRFVVVAQKVREHETRAMLDGQIHDIVKVGQTIRQVTDELEAELNRKLKEVCIAAAGRVLETVTTHVENVFDEERTVTKEDIYTLNSMAVEKAYEMFLEEQVREQKFYCVGSSVIRYFLNDFQIVSLESHKARKIAVDLIATFLPDEVVDGLYKAVELAGLEVVNMTLEPIAAMEVAIPERFRLLNIALVDVGAGTSDISITKDGSIIAYGMIPIAGDSLTEKIAGHCLTDFNTAEAIKKDSTKSDIVTYEDIMGLKQNIQTEEINRLLEPVIDEMTTRVSEKIKRLNGGKPVSAVFVVGGGGKVNGYTKMLSDKMGIQAERVAIRGEDVMRNIDFMDYSIQKDSLLVTPIGICLNFYEQSNNFIMVSFNEMKIKLYASNNLTVTSAAMQANFPNDGFFPRRGKELTFTVNGKKRIVRGEPGDGAQIFVNGKPANMHTPIRKDDIIQVIESTAGDPAKMELGSLPEYKSSITVEINDKRVSLPKFASVNGQLQSESYQIQDQDVIELLDYYTLPQLLEFLDLSDQHALQFYVNNKEAHNTTKIYENFSVVWEKKKETDWNQYIGGADEDPEEEVSLEREVTEVTPVFSEAVPESSGVTPATSAGETFASSTGTWGNGTGTITSTVENVAPANTELINPATVTTVATPIVSQEVTGENLPEEEKGQAVEEAQTEPLQVETPSVETTKPENPLHRDMMVVINDTTVSLKGKSNYIFVDIFDFYPFDISKPKGALVSTVNGKPAQFMSELHDGDKIEIYWRT